MRARFSFLRLSPQRQHSRKPNIARFPNQGQWEIQLRPSKNKIRKDPDGRLIYEKPPYGEWAFIDESGEEQFKVVFKENIARYHRYGEMVGPEVGLFLEGLALVEVNYYQPNPYGSFYDTARYGFINRQGRVVIDPDLDSVGGFVDGLAPVTVTNPDDFRASKAGYIDKDLAKILCNEAVLRGFGRGAGNQLSGCVGLY